MGARAGTGVGAHASLEPVPASASSATASEQAEEASSLHPSGPASVEQGYVKALESQESYANTQEAVESLGRTFEAKAERHCMS